MQNISSSQHSSVVELLICNQWVAGSNPAAGSIFLCSKPIGYAQKEIFSHKGKTAKIAFCARFVQLKGRKFFIRFFFSGG